MSLFLRNTCRLSSPSPGESACECKEAASAAMEAWVHRWLLSEGIAITVSGHRPCALLDDSSLISTGLAHRSRALFLQSWAAAVSD